MQRKISILSHEYDLVEDAKRADDLSICGQVRFMEGYIIIKPDMPRPNKDETLIHEILETLAWHLKIGSLSEESGHDDLCRISEGLTMALKANGLMNTDAFFGKEKKK